MTSSFRRNHVKDSTSSILCCDSSNWDGSEVDHKQFLTSLIITGFTHLHTSPDPEIPWEAALTRVAREVNGKFKWCQETYVLNITKVSLPSFEVDVYIFLPYSFEWVLNHFPYQGCKSKLELRICGNKHTWSNNLMYWDFRFLIVCFFSRQPMPCSNRECSCSQFCHCCWFLFRHFSAFHWSTYYPLLSYMLVD